MAWEEQTQHQADKPKSLAKLPACVSVCCCCSTETLNLKGPRVCLTFVLSLRFQRLAVVTMELSVEKEKGKNVSDLICPVCDQKFIKKHMFERHKKLNNCSKKCLVCGKTFSHAKSARVHALQVHSFARDKQCDRCDKVFKVTVNLMRHINRVHLKNLNYPCEICQFRFFTPQALAAHVDAVHKKIKNFACSFCGKTFSRKTNRDGHEECVHDKTKFYKCKICKVRCNRKHTLKNHMKITHQQSDGLWMSS